MRSFIFYCTFSLLTTSFLLAQQNSQELCSPDGAYEFVLNTNGDLNYSVKYQEAIIVDNSRMGFLFDADKEIDKIFRIKNTGNKKVESSWRPVYGEKREYPDVYNEVLIELEQVDSKDPDFNVRVRAYNEGIAFRYEFPENGRKVKINNEITEFALSTETMVWASTRAQSKIVKMPISQIYEAVERPLLVELPNKYFVAIGEAGLIDFARMKFVLKKDESSTLTSKLSSKVAFNTSFVTPWRFIMVSKKPGTLIENNYLLLNLNEPNKIDDTSWIKPGKVIREVTLTTRGGVACVDFAVKHNLQFVEFDAGWYGDEHDNASDATTVSVDPRRSKGLLELHKVIQYAKSKEIGVILYVNRRSLERQLDEV
ncbi:MAG: glycoside hydrolase family 97 N-terminal domain-containing protein, partial [Bacteroidales bacterium]|nr:glycoside hydrolase family 97 N-terminal domain-containing protein [Bacteroidales bacterium]